MPKQFCHKLKSVFKKLFPKKEEKIITFQGMEWIATSENKDYEYLEFTLINPIKLTKYQTKILFDDFIVFTSIQKHIFNFIKNFTYSENEINFDCELKNEKITLKKIKIEHEDIYRVCFYYFSKLQIKIDGLSRAVKNCDLRKEKKDDREKEKKIKELEKKIKEMELEIEKIKSLNQNFDYLELIEFKKKNTLNSITKMDILKSNQIVYTSDNVYLCNNKLESIPLTKKNLTTFYYLLSVKDENNFITSCQKNIQIWEYDKIESKKNKTKTFKFKEIEFLEPDENEENKDLKFTKDKDKIVEIIYRKNSKKKNIIVFLYYGDIQFLEEKDDGFICLFHLFNNKKLTGGILLEDKNILVSTCVSSEGTKFWNLNNNHSELKNEGLIFQILEARCYSSNAICRIDEDRIIVGGDNNINKKDKIKIISISSQKIIHSINNSGEICFSIFILKKENAILIGGNKSIMIFDIINYNKISSINYNGGINGFLELENDLIISYDINGIITLWKKKKFIDLE